MKNNKLFSELNSFFEKNDAAGLTSTLFSVALRDASENPELYKETDIVFELESVIELITVTAFNLSKNNCVVEYPEQEFQEYINRVISHFTHSSELSHDRDRQTEFFKLLQEIKDLEKKTKEFLTKK